MELLLKSICLEKSKNSKKFGEIKRKLFICLLFECVNIIMDVMYSHQLCFSSKEYYNVDL